MSLDSVGGKLAIAFKGVMIDKEWFVLDGGIWGEPVARNLVL